MRNVRAGFSLVELLVVITIFGAIMIVAMRAFLITISTNDHLSTLTQMKQQGDSGLNLMASMVRNAQEITTCSPTRLIFLNKDGGSTEFHQIATNEEVTIGSGVYGQNEIASNSAFLIPRTTDFRPVPGSLAFSCTSITDDGSTSVYRDVSITFVLQRLAGGNVSDPQTFSTTVGLRKY